MDEYKNVVFPDNPIEGQEIRAQIGICGVDAGCLMLMDPCYVENSFDYARDVMGHCEDRYEDGTPSRHTQIGQGDGVIVSTGFGDGCYPVFGTFRYHSFGGWRVAKVEVQFLFEEALDNEEEVE
jgi:hypothetical protein